MALSRKLALLLTSLTLINVIPHSASAFFGKKLDLAGLQGKYDYVATSDTSIACPETITVTYDANRHRLDSEIFHFANIDQGNQSPDGDGIQTIPDHSAYSEAWVNTKSTSNSVVEKRYQHDATADTSNVPMFPVPLDPSASSGIVDSNERSDHSSEV